MTGAPLLELEAVSKNFRVAGREVRVLREVKFSIRAGETVALRGPSGSGKSTLLGLMAGLEPPSSGRILFRGQSQQDWDQEQLAAWRRRSVGFIFQNFRLIKSLTALENVLLPFEILGDDAAASERRAGEILSRLGLSDRAAHFPHQLSGGEQQRVAIARAYAHGPDLILADEPTGSLDEQTASRVMDSLLEIKNERQALILVTHNPAVAARMSRTLTFSAGSLR